MGDLQRVVVLCGKILILAVVLFGAYYLIVNREGVEEPAIVTSFEECVAAGNPAMESWPRQCRDGDQTFVEDIGNELDKSNLIRIDYPRPNQTIESPLVIKGEARGYWFFEGDFPVTLRTEDKAVVAQGIASAKGDPNGERAGWMTEEFVRFEATLIFNIDKNKHGNKGILVLHKDNPSGLPENYDALEVPIIFSEVVNDDPVGILPFKSGVTGRVLLGPICPVMRDPPDPNCADKPYQTTVQVIAIGSTSGSPFATAKTDKEGVYKVMLPPGEYALQPIGGSSLPRCETKNITIEPETMLEIDLSCDTGIR